MSVFNSISAGVLIILLAAGLITGMALSGTDILNPQTSMAEANQMNVEAAHQQAIYAQEERLADTQTNAQIQTIVRQQSMADVQAAYDREMLALRVRNRERTAAAWLQIAVWMGAAFSVSLVIATFLWVGSKAIANVKNGPASPVSGIGITQNNMPDPWRSEEYRRARILEAKRREQTEHLEALSREQEELYRRMQSLSEPNPTGKAKYDDLPLAG